MMNRKILQRAITELLKENGSKEYVVGILETLVETLPEERVATPANFSSTAGPARARTPEQQENDEGSALDNIAKARIAETKRMAGDV